ncbi:MAG: hypothetical protein HEP69_17530 [Aestuariivita sp.]|nr:hypothetical protein [Aestuariivita sp.]
MTAPTRLPAAPRPFSDELLSSWMVRVAARSGLAAPDMTTWLAGQGREAQPHRLIDDIAPDPELLRLWARACRVDPTRLTRLSLALRFPNRVPTWILERSKIPVCLGCFEADQAMGRDSYMRSDWRLADHLVCPIHRQMLNDRCPACSAQLRVSFQFRSGLLRPFCSRCRGLLTSRRGEPDHNLDAGFAAGVLDLQRQIKRVLQRHDDSRVRLEHAIRTLWAPLDRVDAVRPVLALWFEQPGWHCPFEARAAVSTDAPFQHLPLRWRALTLIILGDLFGAELDFGAEMPETARWLFSRAVPVLPHRQCLWRRSDEEKRSVDWATGRVQRLSKSPVHRLSENFLDERRDFGRIHP